MTCHLMNEAVMKQNCIEALNQLLLLLLLLITGSAMCVKG